MLGSDFSIAKKKKKTISAMVSGNRKIKQIEFSRQENAFAFISSNAEMFRLQLKCIVAAMCAFVLLPHQEKIHRVGSILLMRL